MGKTASEPMYQQIAEDIKKKIQTGEYKENEQIPTETELEKIYGVSRITVRKAMEILVGEEILIRKRRMGTFVALQIAKLFCAALSFTPCS